MSDAGPSPFEDSERAGGATVEDPDDERTPASLLHSSARVGNLAGMQSALEAGAALETKDSWGLAPIHVAALNGSAEAVSLLVERLASVDLMSTRGMTALHLAAAEGMDDVLVRLIDLQANVALPTRTGSTVMNIARRRTAAVAAKEAGLSRPSTPSNLPVGPAEQLIRSELEKSLRQAEAQEEKMRRQLEVALASRQRLESQLGDEAVRAARSGNQGTERISQMGATSPGQTLLPAQAADPAPTRFDNGSNPSAGCSYWQTMADALHVARGKGKDAMQRAWLRALPDQDDLEPFLWTGLLQTKNCLPVPDPDDTDLVEGFDWLKEAMKKTSRLWQSDPFGNSGKIEGKTKVEWDALVQDLQDRDGEWDWSKIEVRQRPGTYKAFGLATVFAAGDFRGEVIFKSYDVIGPLSGVIRRRSRYEQRYYADRSWMLHDAACYAMQLKMRTTCCCGDSALCTCGRRDSPYGHLELEPLVLDLRSGEGQNRLCHLQDVRPDPLGLRVILPEVEDQELVPKGILAPRLRMPRPRSRPTSPEQSLPFGRTLDTIMLPITPASMQSLKGPCDGDPRQWDPKQPRANAKWVEIVCGGLPYVFIIATRTITAGDEITVDWGEDYWAAQRATLTRVLQIGRQFDLAEKHQDHTMTRSFHSRTHQEEEPVFELPKRNRMRRVNQEKSQETLGETREVKQLLEQYA